MKGSDTRPVLTVLQQVLDDAKRDERNRKKGLPIVVPDDTKLLHCVCQQPHIDGALMIQCEGNCQKWYAPIHFRWYPLTDNFIGSTQSVLD